MRVWKRGSAGPLRNTAQIGMQLLCRAAATCQALNFKSHVHYPISPAPQGRCCFPSDIELKGVSTAACLHLYPSSAVCLCDLEQST